MTRRIVMEVSQKFEKDLREMKILKQLNKTWKGNKPPSNKRMTEAMSNLMNKTEFKNMLINAEMEVTKEMKKRGLV